MGWRRVALLFDTGKRIFFGWGTQINKSLEPLQYTSSCHMQNDSLEFSVRSVFYF